jgi:hypothetical protein
MTSSGKGRKTCIRKHFVKFTISLEGWKTVVDLIVFTLVISMEPRTTVLINFKLGPGQKVPKAFSGQYSLEIRLYTKYTQPIFSLLAK